MNINPSSIQTPDLRALFQAHTQEVMAALNCHQVGKIVSFDPAKQTAKVQIMVKRVVYNQKQAIDAKLQTTPEYFDYPVLVDCPVFVHTGGTGTITLPVAAGDSCLVLFNDRDIDIWYATGSSGPPNSQRMHSLSDGFALVGFRNTANQIASYSTTDIELKNSGGKIQVAAKIGISNASTSLLTALDALCTALTSWVDTNGDSPNTGTIAAITNAKSLIDSLLK